jgi:NAD-dependent SIR2 family protein deacetylase
MHVPLFSDAPANAALIAREREELLSRIARSRRLTVLTGAGCSTASGIPDYRDANGDWKRTPPMRFQDFIASHAARQRYWARSLIGWRQFSTVEPNAAHLALAALEGMGRLGGLITQNVDGLHRRAGSQRVIDLHGCIDRVACLQCERRTPRIEFQVQLELLNPGWSTLPAALAPDGDALLEDAGFSTFIVPECETCSGILKPDVVFFGEAVPRERVSDAFRCIAESDLLLVAGSSLMVYSGYRFARAAREQGTALVIVNLGRTRADAEADLKISADCAEVLPWIATALAK